MRTYVEGAANCAEEVPKNFREALTKANLSATELKELGRLRIARPAVDFAITVLLVALTPVLYRLLPNPFVFVICILLSLHCFSRFASMVHGSDHGNLFPDASANRWVGNLCAYFMGYTRAGHRAAHQVHHTHLNTVGDADRIWGAPDESVGTMVKTLAQDLFLISAIRRLMQYTQTDRKAYENSPWKKLSFRFVWRGIGTLLPVIPIQLALLGYYTVIAGPQYYLYFYVIPIMTLYPAIIRMRSMVEHSFPVGYVPAAENQSWVTRSTRANIFERFVVAPLDGHMHFEHHLLPGVPYYQLAQVHALIESRGMKIPSAPGYFSFLLEKWRLEKSMRLAITSGQ